MDRLRSVWETLRSSLWFIPTLMVLGAVLLAVALIDAESFINRERLAQEWPRLLGGGAEGARGMLSAIAGSMITVAGVVVSITTVSFTLAASQYTSRILRTFMSDRGSQAALGVFLGVFAYCLVVLRTIRGGDEGVFVPTLAVLGAFLLALVAIGFLVYFIHHVASSIQASVIIHSVTHETLDAVDRLYPGRAADAAGAAEEPPLHDTVRLSVPSQKTGYIQALNRELLLRSAREQNTVIRMERRVGEFVFEGLPLASVTGGHAGRELVEHINRACVVGRHATMQQDIAFGIRQIVDIALKALSPGINDTTTATICLDHLGAILARLAGRELGPGHLSDAGGVRVLLRTSSYSEYVTIAFAQIREHAGGNAAVLARLLEVLSLIAPHAPPHRRHALEVQRDAVLESVERTVPAPAERRQIRSAAERLAGVLRQVSP
jgi:uncharacterized membrane protein